MLEECLGEKVVIDLSSPFVCLGTLLQELNLTRLLVDIFLELRPRAVAQHRSTLLQFGPQPFERLVLLGQLGGLLFLELDFLVA